MEKQKREITVAERTLMSKGFALSEIRRVCNYVLQPSSLGEMAGNVVHVGAGEDAPGEGEE